MFGLIVINKTNIWQQQQTEKGNKQKTRNESPTERQMEKQSLKKKIKYATGGIGGNIQQTLEIFFYIKKNRTVTVSFFTENK